jgi:hypothetical protein
MNLRSDSHKKFIDSMKEQLKDALKTKKVFEKTRDEENVRLELFEQVIARLSKNVSCDRDGIANEAFRVEKEYCKQLISLVEGLIKISQEKIDFYEAKITYLKSNKMELK